MRLLLITADFPPIPSGEANHSYYLGINLARRGIDVHVLTSEIEGVVRPPNVTVHPLMRRWSWAGLRRLRAALRSCAPDGVLLIYLGEMYNFHPMMTFAASTAKAVLPGARFVTQFEYAHTPEQLASRHSWRQPLWTRAVRKGVVWRLRDRRQIDSVYGTLLRDSDHLIVLSDLHRRRLEAHAPPFDGKCSLIPPAPIMAACGAEAAVARARGRALLGLRDEDFALTYYGYLYDGKGIETLFRAAQLVSSAAGRQKQLRVVVVGGCLEHTGLKKDPADSKGYTEMVRELPRKLGIADRVTWTGLVPAESEQAGFYLRAADACVLPFDSGVYLNNSSFAAAAAHGLPTITTQGELLEQPFVHEENVYLCPPQDPRAMAAAIEKLMADPGLCERLRVGALRLAQEWFSWDRVVERTLAAFGEAPAPCGL